MPALWFIIIIHLTPINRLTSIVPTQCQNLQMSKKSSPFLIQDHYELKGDHSFQEMHFNLNFSSVWTAGASQNISPDRQNSVKILSPNKTPSEKTNNNNNNNDNDIYKKAEEFINEITRLMPVDVKVNVTGVWKQGLLQMKKYRKSQRLEKRLQIGIYHRLHKIDSNLETNYSSRIVPQMETNGSINFNDIFITRNNTDTLGINYNQYQSNCSTYKSIESTKCVDEIISQFRSRWPVHLWLPQNFSTFNIHWLKFGPPSPAAHYTLAVLYAIIMVFGVFGNAFAIYMFLRCRSLRTPANILVMNLAVSDLLLLSKMPVFIYNSIYMGPALGNFACQLYGFVGGMTGTVSIATLASIAADRYNVVAEPFKRTTYARARVTVALTWVYGATFAGLPLLIPSLGSYKPEGYLTSCSFDYLTQDTRVKAFILCFFFAAWVLPFCLISFCYLGILRVVLAARHMNIGPQVAETSNKHCREEEKRRTELRLAFVVIGIIGMWFVSWSPYAVVALLGVSGNTHLVTPLSSMVPALICKTASCLDPYVYAVTHPRFKSELHHLTKRSRRKRSARQWSPQHRTQLQGARSSRVLQDGIDHGVEEEMQCIESIEIISMASHPSASRETTNFTSLRSTSCSYHPRGEPELY